MNSFDKLKRSCDFSNTFKKAESFHTKYSVIFYLKSDQNKVGVVASKKVGKATIRNKAKRRLRSIFRDLQDLENGIYIFVARAGIDGADFSKVKKDISYALGRLGAVLRK